MVGLAALKATMQHVKELVSKYRDGLILAGLNCFLAGVTVAWLRLDSLPPAWDDAWYLTNSLVMFDALVDGGLIGFGRRFLTMLALKPPLITVLPAPFYLMLGRNPENAFGVNLVFIPILLASVYLLGRRCWNSRAGLIAAYVTATMPMLYGLARWYLIEFVLTAFICVGVLLLMESRNLGNPKSAFYIGVMWGLGLLLKVSFPLYYACPFLYVFARFAFTPRTQPPEGPGGPSKLGLLLRLSLPAILLPLPWYLINYRRTLRLALAAGFSSEADIYGTGPVFSASAINTYLVHLINVGPSCYYAALAIALLAWMVLSGKLRFFLQRLAGEPLIFLCLWALPFVVFLFGRNKNVRYVAPLLPVLALALGFTLDFVVGKTMRWRGTLLCLLLTFPGVAMIHTSFGILGRWRLGIGNLILVAPNLDYARNYDRSVWPHLELLKTAYESAQFDVGEKKLLMVGTGRAAFNTNNLDLASVRARLPFDFISSAYEKDLGELLKKSDSAFFFVYKEGGEPESPAYNIHQTALVRHVRESGRFTEVPYGRMLPDGGVAHIFKNLSPGSAIRASAFVPASLGQVAACAVDFADKVRLTGLSIVQSPHSLQVKYRWRCLKRLDREYWCFTHILDQNNKVIGYLDHQVLHGGPPMTTWNSGDEAVENLEFNFSEPQPEGSIHLKLGLYHLASGERLPIGAFTGPGPTKFSLADQNTALQVEQCSSSGNVAGGSPHSQGSQQRTTRR